MGPPAVLNKVDRQGWRPTRVSRALTALWAAWGVTATALLVNQFYFHGTGIGPGLSLGLVSLAIQAVVFVSVGRGSHTARALAIIFLVLATLPLQMLGRLITERSIVTATYTAIGLALKASGVFLLFTGDSRGWFAAEN